MSLKALDSVVYNRLQTEAETLVNTEIDTGGDLLMAMWIFRGAEIEELEPNSLFEQCMEIGRYIQERGSLV